jgi:hypothetical protein
MPMAYLVTCQVCNLESKADNIVDLFENHIGPAGFLKCIHCNSDGAYIFKESKLQEKGEIWTRYIKGIIRIRTENDTYNPYILLTSDTINAPITGFHFNYYKDTRKQGGVLKHGHGPGGAPVLTKIEIMYFLNRLLDLNILSNKDFIQLINSRKNQA